MTAPQGFDPDEVRLAWQVGHGRQARLLHDLHYTDDRGRRHTARAGLWTDGGSKPRLFWRCMGHPWDRFLPAYVIHDHYCDAAADVEDAGQDAEAARLRLEADRLFREMLAWLGARRWQQHIYYAGVRIGAWWHGLTD